MESYELFNEKSQAFFYNLKKKPIQSMLDFDYLSARDLPSVAAIIHPGRDGFHKAFFGNCEILIPIYHSISLAVEKHPNVETMINFASFRSAFRVSKEALNTNTIKNIVIVAEGIAEREARDLIALAKQKDKVIIGPATVGGIAAGKFRIGHAGGTNENIIRAKLFRPGSVGLVSKSGGMMNELFNIITRSTDGVCEGIAIGGDKFPGSTLLDHILRYEKNPKVKLIVALGELGGRAEYDIIEAKKADLITKPIVMWVSGTCADIFPFEVQFGHAGAKANKDDETATAKNKALREAGIIVPESFADFEATSGREFLKLVENGVIEQKMEENNAKIPVIDENRKSTNFISTISDERGEEPYYNGVALSKLLSESKGIGHTIGLLWFKKELPDNFAKFLEQCLVIVADHGPAVSGAHNAIVTSRAGKDIMSSLCSGLLTIGPRFGGAIDDACRNFKQACDEVVSAEEFVAQMKKKGKYIPGIGHRVKSKSNPDKRVEFLKDFARENFNETKYLNYALAVEQVTLQKAENLILNVDGCIAALFLDALSESGMFSSEEVDQIVSIGYMNGLFALGRSIGIIGHVLDQKRLGEGLYRHPIDDILYVK